MEEKLALRFPDGPPSAKYADDFPSTRSKPAMHSIKQRPFRTLLSVIFSLYIVWAFVRAFRYYCPDLTLRQTPQHSHLMHIDHTSRVPLEAHIMSKCPDARDCLQQLVVPTMEQIESLVDFKLSFIGRVDASSDAVSCMHGPGECLGNIIILCAAKLYPEPKLHLGFANCMISDFPDIPQRDLIEQCAMEHSLDFGKINDCISDGGEGMALLRSSVERSQEAGVQKSCTVRLDGKIWCIRDDGEWTDCKSGNSVDALVRAIKRLSDSELNMAQ